ncbi:MAG: hypothetical protein IPJ13_14315 [Saprospiraceae bacterium]|nr:hypothetical protein [Saprospiraceae bacterium]
MLKPKPCFAKDLLRQWEWDANLTTGAICVYHSLIPYAVDALKGAICP